MGIAPLPCYVGDPEPDLERLDAPPLVVRQDVWLVVHEDLRHTARVRVCADFLATSVRAQAGTFAGNRANLTRKVASAGKVR
jgi:DNA-binding transcriptional LysR family regulator